MYIRCYGRQLSLSGSVVRLGRRKAAANLKKHEISFEKACEAFFDPFLMLLDAGPDDEAREAALGLSENWNLLYVVHIAWEKDSIRIISAREATPAERRMYENF